MSIFLSKALQAFSRPTADQKNIALVKLWIGGVLHIRTAGQPRSRVFSFQVLFIPNFRRDRIREALLSLSQIGIEVPTRLLPINMSTNDDTPCEITIDDSFSSSTTRETKRARNAPPRTDEDDGSSPAVETARCEPITLANKRSVVLSDTGTIITIDEEDETELARLCSMNTCVWTAFWMLRFWGLLAGTLVVGMRLMRYVHEYNKEQMEAEVSLTYCRSAGGARSG